MSGIDWRLSPEEFLNISKNTQDPRYYLGEWTHEVNEQKLTDLAHKYHKLCEEYDKTICTGKCEYSGLAMPITALQKKQVTENALNILKQIYDEGLQQGFNKHQISKAISSIVY